MAYRSVLISDRDVRFTSRFWRELWRILGTNIRMGSGFHPQSSGQVEIYNKLLEQTLRCTIHQLGETRNWVVWEMSRLVRQDIVL